MVSLLASCGGEKANSGTPSAEADKPILKVLLGEEKEQKKKAPAEVIPWEGKFLSYDLLENLSFAHLWGTGLRIDFGTSDYYKYTLGGWRTGWGRNRQRDGVLYTHAVGDSARVYFPWERSEDLLIRFRARRFGARFFSLYVNDKPVQKVNLNRADWEVYTAEVPAERIRAGENYMLLRWDRTSREGDERVAAGVDSIEILPGAAAEADAGAVAAGSGTTAGQAAITAEIGSGEQKVSALVLPGGARLSYLLQVPEPGPLLGFRIGIVPDKSEKSVPDLTLQVEGVADGREPAKLLSRTVAGAQAGTFSPVGVDMKALAGEVVRLDLRVSSSTDSRARLALLSPALYVEPSPAPVVEPAARAKNTIVIMIDTLRADHCAPFNGKTRVLSPAFNQLAERGALFERFSAVEDWTKPSCATMLTGLYPDTHKIQTEGAKLPAKVKMISEEMAERSVSTGAFIANGYVSGKFGFERGWDRYTNYIREGKKTDAEYVFKDAIEWIEKVKDKRFYAYIHTIDPHVPYAPPDAFLELYDKEPYHGPVQPRKTAYHLEDIKKGKFNPTGRDKERILALYDGEISYHDKYLGKFLERLNALGLMEDTLIMAVSDHGEEFWDHGSVGHGHQIHQELIHVPFLLIWKGTISGKVRIAENHDHSCMVPTTFDAMGLEPPDYLEGKSVLSAALGRQQPALQAGFSSHQGDRQAVWSGKWKLLMRGPINTYLYDTDDDPGCQSNLKKKRPITLAYLRALLGQFQGCADKARWSSRGSAGKQKRKVEQEKVEMDDELRKQLKNLGYFH